MTYFLSVHLISDATFGTGGGIAGDVDANVEHDPRTGLPRVRGRTLRGLLVEECANLLWSLKQANHPRYDDWERAAARLWGQPGSTAGDEGILRVGTAQMGDDLRRAVRFAVENEKHSTVEEVLSSLTCVRRQTAITDDGGQKKNSLRAQRAVLRETDFRAPLDFVVTPTDDEIALLADCARCTRRGGMARTRGRGRIRVRLCRATGEETATVPYKEAAP